MMVSATPPVLWASLSNFRAYSPRKELDSSAPATGLNLKAANQKEAIGVHGQPDESPSSSTCERDRRSVACALCGGSTSLVADGLWRSWPRDQRVAWPVPTAIAVGDSGSCPSVIVFHLSNNMRFAASVKRFVSIPWHGLALSLLVAAPGAVRTQEAQEAKTPVFAVKTADGSSPRGAWRRLKPDWSVRIGEGDGNFVSGADLLSVRRVNVPLPPAPLEDYLILVNGDRLPYRSLRL